MSDKPISFPAPMVRALLAGTKTQTRRVIRGVPMFSAEYDRQWHPHVLPPGGAMPDAWSWWEGPSHGPSMYHHQKLSIGKGDRLYVREHWRTGGQHDHLAPRDMPPGWAFPIEYLADGTDHRNGRFRQGMHMPRWASRITLTVTDVRVQRLQDISEEDAKAEGLTSVSKDGRLFKWGIPDLDGLPGTDDFGWPWTKWDVDPRQAYRALWEAINGPGSWDANPWVAAYTFTVQLGNIDQLAEAA